MKPRITLNLTHDGQLEIWLNQEGRDQLIRELQALGEKNDHFHLDPLDFGDVELSMRAYRPTDTVIESGKVLFRTDDWDRQYFPHVLDDSAG